MAAEFADLTDLKFTAVRHLANEEEQVVTLDVTAEVTDEDSTVRAIQDSRLR